MFNKLLTFKQQELIANKTGQKCFFYFYFYFAPTKKIGKIIPESEF